MDLHVIVPKRRTDCCKCDSLLPVPTNTNCRDIYCATCRWLLWPSRLYKPTAPEQLGLPPSGDFNLRQLAEAT